MAPSGLYARLCHAFLVKFKSFVSNCVLNNRGNFHLKLLHPFKHLQFLYWDLFIAAPCSFSDVIIVLRANIQMVSYRPRPFHAYKPMHTLISIPSQAYNINIRYARCCFGL